MARVKYSPVLASILYDENAYIIFNADREYAVAVAIAVASGE
jgi:hypothetical protein